MGQYHMIANLDKLEILNPHRLGCGLKVWEQLANSPGVGAALIVLITSASNGAGGGDLSNSDEGSNGPCQNYIAERDGSKNGMIGRWRGDRIVMVGDYDDGSLYDTQMGPLTGAQIYGGENNPSPFHWVDISDKVAAVIEKELDGKFSGDGWRDWKKNKEPQAAG